MKRRSVKGLRRVQRVKQSGARAARVGVLGVPFDANSSFRRGAARAPRAIRAALGSPAGNAYSGGGRAVWPAPDVRDHGDISLLNRSGVQAPFDSIEQAVGRALEATPRMLVFGGDHAVTWPIVRAMRARYGTLSLLHVDAHPDLYPSYEGNRYSHACPMARILEQGLVRRLVQVGIRSRSPEQIEVAQRHGVEVRAATSELPAELVFDEPLYVSIDLDGIDPAFAPGVAHPEPGGLSVRDVQQLLAAVRAPELVGADIVELNPRLDVNGQTARVAAKLAKELLDLLQGPMDPV